ncbi:MAG: M28 family metallopeptidase [Gemmatimonadota bacterium]|nr:M28 family metallopeptidase [Gemmatimonadota bacterium]
MRSMMSALAATGALALAGCGAPAVPGAALESFSTDDLTAHIAVLASDSFAGRGPASVGEDRTMAYLQAEFERLGLEPGNGASWYQEVPLVRIAARPDAELSVRGQGAQARFRYGDDFVANSKHLDDAVGVADAEIVFVGYGIVAPEYGWNDYAGLDVRGKTVMILVNDPGFATGDSTLFRGHTMTYYGRWTYKFEEASRQGAAAAFVIHETEPAAYGWDVVRNSWSGPQFSLAAADANESRVAVEGWVTLETARAIVRLGGQEYDSLKVRAARAGFAPVPLGVTAAVSLRQEVLRSSSRNFVARLPGTDHADEHIIYMAHWDHFGTDPAREGDQIFNGAEDNATGTAGLIEMAKAFTSLAAPPSRSILFLAVTAEEQGLLGSAFYGEHPIVPLEKTVAAINMDGMNVLGPMRDVIVIGLGMSELDDYMVEAAAEQGRVVRPDAEPEKGYYYRSDHFSLAKQGVPALDPGSGQDHVEHGVEWTQQREAEYRAERYHMPADEMLDSWDLRGLVQDLQLFFTVGYRLSMNREFPNWRQGSEFKALRDAMMLGTE